MRGLLVLALLAARAASACECAPGDFTRLREHPEIAETALLGRAEKTAFRVEASWTKFAGAVLLPRATKCDINPEAGRRLILLSVRSLDWFVEHNASPSICDTLLLEPGKAGLAVNRLASRWDGAARTEPNPTWGYCRRDKDCVLSPGVCPGMDGVHVRFKTAHDAWRARVAPTVNCSGSGVPSGLKARCEENVCAAYSPAP